MKRDFIEIVTPNKYKVKIKTWLNGLERQAINLILLECADKDKIKDGDVDIESIDLKGRMLIQNETVRQYLYEIKDENDKIVEGDLFDSVMELKEEEVNFIVEKVNEIVGKKEKSLKA